MGVPRNATLGVSCCTTCMCVAGRCCHRGKEQSSGREETVAALPAVWSGVIWCVRLSLRDVTCGCCIVLWYEAAMLLDAPAWLQKFFESPQRQLPANVMASAAAAPQHKCRNGWPCLLDCGGCCGLLRMVMLLHVTAIKLLCFAHLVHASWWSSCHVNG